MKMLAYSFSRCDRNNCDVLVSGEQANEDWRKVELFVLFHIDRFSPFPTKEDVLQPGQRSSWTQTTRVNENALRHRR